MLGSLNAGASGVKAHNASQTVTGSNIANVNTIGYKKNRVGFQDLIKSHLNGASDEHSQGVQVQSVKAIFDQGSFELTGQETDMAIDGGGFFVMKDEFNRQYYTRNGDFKINDEGFLSNMNNHKVMVSKIDQNTGRTLNDLEPINLFKVVSPPKKTGDGLEKGTGIKVEANLSAETEPPKIDMNLEDVRPEMYNFATNVKVYDELGAEFPVTVAFRKLPDMPAQLDPNTGEEIPGTRQKNVWAWFSVTDGANLKDGIPGVQQATGGGFIQFGEDGRMLTTLRGEVQEIPGLNGQPSFKTLVQMPELPGVERPQVAFNFKGVSEPLVAGFDFGDGTNPLDPSDGRSGLDGLTFFSGKNKLNKIDNDGNKGGVMESFNVDSEGIIQGVFDSGVIEAVGKVQLADFASPTELKRAGNNRFEETNLSGLANVGDPGASGRGRIISKNLERSNVDLADEFVKVIENQRAFQASAKNVTTGDQILMDVINMKS